MVSVKLSLTSTKTLRSLFSVLLFSRVLTVRGGVCVCEGRGCVCEGVVCERGGDVCEGVCVRGGCV